jgi:hypothetical protein
MDERDEVSNTESDNLSIIDKNLDVVFEDLPNTVEELYNIELEEVVYGDEEVTDTKLEDWPETMIASSHHFVRNICAIGSGFLTIRTVVGSMELVSQLHNSD